MAPPCARGETRTLAKKTAAGRTERSVDRPRTGRRKAPAFQIKERGRSVCAYTAIRSRGGAEEAISAMAAASSVR